MHEDESIKVANYESDLLKLRDPKKQNVSSSIHHKNSAESIFQFLDTWKEQKKEEVCWGIIKWNGENLTETMSAAVEIAEFRKLIAWHLKSLFKQLWNVSSELNDNFSARAAHQLITHVIIIIRPVAAVCFESANFIHFSRTSILLMKSRKFQTANAFWGILNAIRLFRIAWITKCASNKM